MTARHRQNAERTHGAARRLAVTLLAAATCWAAPAARARAAEASPALAQYKAALDTLDLRLQTGFYSGNPSDSALAVATLVTGTAYWAGLNSLFVVPGAAADFVPLAQLFADCVIHDKDVKNEVSAYRQKFLTMQYCLPMDEAAGLAARVITSLFPASDFAKVFAENLSRLV